MNVCAVMIMLERERQTILSQISHVDSALAALKEALPSRRKPFLGLRACPLHNSPELRTGRLRYRKRPGWWTKGRGSSAGVNPSLFSINTAESYATRDLSGDNEPSQMTRS
jgi:hypothetical protein